MSFSPGCPNGWVGPNDWPRYFCPVAYYNFESSEGLTFLRGKVKTDPMDMENSTDVTNSTDLLNDTDTMNSTDSLEPLLVNSTVVNQYNMLIQLYLTVVNYL